MMFDFRGRGKKWPQNIGHHLCIFPKQYFWKSVPIYTAKNIFSTNTKTFSATHKTLSLSNIFTILLRKNKTNLKTVKIGKICKSAPIIFAGGLCSKRIFILISLVVSFGRGGRGWPTGSCTRTPGGWGSPGRWGPLGTPRTWTLWRQSGCRTISRIWSWSNWRWPLFVLFWNIQKNLLILISNKFLLKNFFQDI